MKNYQPQFIQESLRWNRKRLTGFPEEGAAAAEGISSPLEREEAVDN
jgi:hypothetical protein